MSKQRSDAQVGQLALTRQAMTKQLERELRRMGYRPRKPRAAFIAGMQAKLEAPFERAVRKGMFAGLVSKGEGR
jgi:hypothetical protein